MARQKRVLREAEISPRAVNYGVTGIAVVFLGAVVTIPLLPAAVLFGGWYYRRYYRSLSVTLTTRELIVRRGVWVKTESTVPLEKVTDVGMVQGPIMRRYGVKGLRIETAGQTGASGIGLLNIIGIVDADDFRDAVLDQRDRVSDREDGLAPSSESPTAPPSADPARDGEMIELLREIRDHVSRIR